MNKDLDFNLEINSDVYAKMAAVATLEVEGVAGLVNKTTDIKEVFSKTAEAKAIKVNSENGVVSLDIYISVINGCNVREVAEKVQANVKTKLQNMTGSVMEKVNVIIADVVFDEE